MGFVVKMSVGTDIRRRRFEDASEVSFEVIADMVRENFGFTSFSATYRDDEGDVCSLTSLTLPDAVSLSGGSLRLEIQEVVQSAGSTASRWTAGVEPCEGLSGHSPLDNVTSFSIGTPVPSSSPCNSISSSIRDTWLLEEGGPQHQADSDSGTLLGNSDSNSTWDGVEPSDSATRIAHQAETMLNLSDDEIQDERVGATSHDDVVPAEEETSPIPPPSAPPQEQTPEEQHEEGSITDSEKVLIILAAFDADGDGRLSFREANALQQAAWGGRVSWRSFARVCADVGVSARQGLGPAERRIVRPLRDIGAGLPPCPRTLAGRQPAAGKKSHILDHLFPWTQLLAAFAGAARCREMPIAGGAPRSIGGQPVPAAARIGRRADPDPATHSQTLVQQIPPLAVSALIFCSR
eukprot:CAMPEP_0115377002 /NCGR_PEP_ID=MMETSP0271-20121206/3265_1 /TAXON_ID=71861 /ORGANISM="Scrippsiella trochoidea, Strain CCMP3099" /LENGTH=406 /DNA_ID=CAMNT_0002800107 /DNA_START=63 /DNA_END=1283 /DNA_ORIENTATION=+